MGVTITQPGEAKAAAQAGAIIGKGKRAEEDRARAEREQARSEQIAAQQKARQAALEWEQQKMALNSQQDFMHEMRMKQAGLDAEARAREWQVEKMEMASRLDFEQEEQERLRDNAMWAAGDKAIDESDMPETEKPRARFRNYQKHPDARGAIEDSGFTEEKQPSIAEQRWDLLTPEEQKSAVRKTAGLEPRATVPKEEKPIFTPYNVQKGLGVLSTGAPSSALGIPLPVLESKEEHEQWAEKNWGPHWKTLVPEAIDILNEKFGTNDLKPLSVDGAKQFLLAAGGNIEEAQKLARQAGYEVK